MIEPNHESLSPLVYNVEFKDGVSVEEGVRQLNDVFNRLGAGQVLGSTRFLAARSLHAIANASDEALENIKKLPDVVTVTPAQTGFVLN